MKKFTKLSIGLIALVALFGFGYQQRGIVSRGDVSMPAANSLNIGTAELTATKIGQITNHVVEAKTGNYPVVAATDSGKVFTSVGASGTITITLPAATVGQNYMFRVGAAQQLRIDPDGTEVIALPSTGVAGAAGKYLVADADGETVHLVCTKAGTWSVMGYTGSWTAEP